MSSASWRRALAVGIMWAASADPAAGQSTPPEASATLEGQVTAARSGRPVAGVLIRLQGTPLFRLTDGEGRFRFPGLDGGEYVVLVSAPGFRDQRREDVQVRAGEEASLAIVLEEEAFELPALVVTASRGAEGFGESTAGVDIVTEADIEEHGAVTVDQALRFASGVNFNAQQMDVRGVNGLARGIGSRVLMMVDGHRFLSGTTGGISFEAVPILGIQRIEVVKGPASTLYGSNALGGVVNVIRAPIPSRPETTIRAHYGVYDTPDQYAFASRVLDYEGLDLRHARRFGRVGMYGGVSRSTSDGYRQNGNYERNFLDTGVSLLREEGPPILEVFGLWSHENRGEYFQWSDPKRPLEVAPGELGDHLHGDNIQVGATATPITNGDVLLQIRGDILRSDYKNHFHDARDYHLSTRYSLDAQASLYQAQGHVVTVGVEGGYTPVKANILGRPVLYDLAAYAQEDFRLSQVLRTTAGIRVDFHDTSSGTSELQFNPKLGVVYSPSERMRYRASVSRGYRAPSAVEQFVSSTQFGFHVVPNPGLKGESAWAFEIGASGRVTDWGYLEAGLFHTAFDGLIEPAPVPGGEFGNFQFRNVARARIRGIDASIRLGLAEDALAAQVNYVLLDTKDERTGQPLPYRSKHNLTVSADYLFLGLDVQYRSRVERVLAYPLDPRKDIKLVTVRFGFPLAGASVQLKVDNLFQETYVDVQERNLGPSRSVQLMVQTTLPPHA